MSLKTITYDADVYQLMPKVATDEMNAAAAYTETFAEAYTALLAAAPQPEPLSPWLPTNDFILNADKTIYCWIEYKGETKIALFDAVMKKFLYVGGGASCFLTECISHVMPLPLPQAPTASLDATGATAPEVE